MHRRIKSIVLMYFSFKLVAVVDPCFQSCLNDELHHYQVFSITIVWLFNCAIIETFRYPSDLFVAEFPMFSASSHIILVKFHLICGLTYKFWKIFCCGKKLMWFHDTSSKLCLYHSYLSLDQSMGIYCCFWYFIFYCFLETFSVTFFQYLPWWRY